MRLYKAIRKSYLIACLFVLAGGIVWVSISPQNEFARMVLQAGIFGCLYIILVAFHELGHVLVALMTKTKVLQVTIGLGEILYNHDCWGIEWQFCAAPICGCTTVSLTERKFYRTKSFLIFLGGPLANCLLILAGAVLFFHISSPFLVVAIKLFIAANVLDLLISIVPREVNFTGTAAPTDGLRLLTIPFESESTINKEIEAYCAWEGYSYFKKGRYEDAARIYKAGLAQFPTSATLQSLLKQATEKIEDAAQKEQHTS